MPHAGHRAVPGGTNSGQSIVLVCLWLAAMLGFAAIAIDVGRFLAERRFLQNAVDAAALAGATALVNGGSSADAEAAARAVLTSNLAADPTGQTAPPPPTLPVYAPGHAGEPAHLVEGVLVTPSGVRVAVRNPITYTFGRVVGALTQDIGARAHAGYSGNLRPIAVRRFVHAPGPNAGAIAPCPDDQTRFMDFFATANSACLGSEGDASPRTPPSAGAPFDPLTPGSDPAYHGPIVTILGQGAQPSNGSDFRGFIVLDIRNFHSSLSQVYYNGVTSGTTANTLKDIEAGWIRGGYPGPPFPTATFPLHPDSQVAVMSGNSTGIVIDEVDRYFAPGDEILVAVYPGQVMTIPDFAVTPPATIALPTTGTTANAGSLKVSRNQSFSGQVTLSTLADSNDPENPMALGTMTGTEPITYNPNPVTPSLGNGTTVELQNVTTAGAAPGIYALWVKGQAGSPYLTTKYEPFAVKIGTVTRDFTITADAAVKDAVAIGDTVTFNLSLTNAPNKNTNFGAVVRLCLDPPLPAGVGATSLGTSCASGAAVTPSRNGTSYTLSINTGSMAVGSHRFIVRATGLNGDPTPRPVTHVLPLTVNVATSDTSGGGNQDYVDIVGFAVMRIASVGSNAIDAYAITPVISDPNDPTLRRGQEARLFPW